MSTLPSFDSVLSGEASQHTDTSADDRADLRYAAWRDGLPLAELCNDYAAFVDSLALADEFAEWHAAGNAEHIAQVSA